MATNKTEGMTDINRTIADFDGWIYSKSGATAQRGKNGPSYRTKDVRYDSYNKLMPVYQKLRKVARYDEAGRMFARVQNQLLWGTVEEFRDKIFEFVKWINENQNA